MKIVFVLTIILQRGVRQRMDMHSDGQKELLFHLIAIYRWTWEKLRKTNCLPFERNKLQFTLRRPFQEWVCCRSNFSRIWKFYDFFQEPTTVPFDFSHLLLALLKLEEMQLEKKVDFAASLVTTYVRIDFSYVIIKDSGVPSLFPRWLTKKQ